MNADRRSRVIKAKQLLEEAKDILEEALNEEDEYRDNIPENLQNSERYEQSETYSDAMDNAINEISSAIESLEEVT